MRRFPADVPVDRPSVGAMSVTTGSQMPAKITQPYVYKGTGEDQFPETDYETQRERERRERKRRQEQERRAKERRAKQRERARQYREAERERERQRVEAKRAAGWKPGDEGRVALVKIRARQAAEREARRAEWEARHPKPRPAAGWKPMTGDDIEELLSDL